MSVKAVSMYAELTLKDLMTQALNTAKGSLTGFSSQTLKTIGSIVGITSAVAIAGMAFQKFTGFVKDSVLISARVEEMDAVLKVLGKTAGLTAGEIDKQVQALKDVGIQTDIAQKVVADFIRYELNMADATDLARVAQDGAVLAMQNSSEALDGLIYGITTFNPRILKTYGILIDSNTAFDNYGETIGKAGDELSSAEKQQAFLNAVIEGGTTIAGAYEAAMETASKQLRNTTRYSTELKIVLGDMINSSGLLTEAIKGLNQGIIKTTSGLELLIRANQAGLTVGELVILMLGEGIDKYDDLSVGLGIVEEAERKATKGADDFGKSSKYAAKEVDDLSASIENGTGTLIDYKDQLDTVVDGAKMLDDQEKKLKDAIDKVTQAGKDFIEYREAHPEDTEGIENMRTAYQNLKTDVNNIQAANELQTKEWIANLLLQQLSLGEEGLSGAEMKYYLQYMEHNGLITTESATLAQAMWDDTATMAEGFGNVTNAVSGTNTEIGKVPKDVSITMTYGEKGTENYNKWKEIKDKTVTVVINYEEKGGYKNEEKGGYKNEEKGGYKSYAGGGSFSGMAMVGDAPGGGITPYTEWVYAPHGATVFNQSQMSAMGGIPALAGGGEIPPVSQSSEVNLSSRSVRELADALFYKLQAVI